MQARARHRSIPRGVLLTWFVLPCVGCSNPVAQLREGAPPSTYASTGSTGAGGTDDATQAAVTFEPDAPFDRVARVTRIDLQFPQPPEPSDVFLFSGTLSALEARAVTRGSVSKALAERRIDTIAWVSAGDSSRLVVVPTRTLEAGATYTLALGGLSFDFPFVVSSADGWPVLRRTWPAPGIEGSGDFAVWCGEAPLPPLDRPWDLDPGGAPGVLASGLGAPFEVPECVRWSGASSDEFAAGPLLVSPSLVTFDDGTGALLEPVVLQKVPEFPAASTVPCDGDRMLFGLGCVGVEDDRLWIDPPQAPSFWAIVLPSGVRLHTSSGQTRFVVRPIPAASSVHLQVATVDARGVVASSELVVTTPPPSAHLVLNEVFANPAGPEPAQEWIELINDGAVAVDLAGYRIEDAGGSSLLPAAMMEPSAFALIVPEAWVADDGVDPAPPISATVVRVAALGKGGLSNSGEAIVLRNPAGTVVSRFAAIAPKSGQSVARTTPDAVDDDPGSFAASPNGSATPGKPNFP